MLLPSGYTHATSEQRSSLPVSHQLVYLGIGGVARNSRLTLGPGLDMALSVWRYMGLPQYTELADTEDNGTRGPHRAEA